MKKLNLFLTLLMMTFPLVISSCSSDEEDSLLNKEKSENQQNEYATMGHLRISPVADTRSNQVQNYDVNFDNDNGESC